EEIRFWIDDLRATPAADQGYVILSFDDGAATQYERAFPILEEYGYQGALAVIPDSLNRPQRLSIDQLREMRDAGWDVSSHPDPGTGLAEVDPEEARNTIQSAFQYLDNRGFPDGARHMFAPYHSINQEVIDIAREYHETCFYFAGNNSNVPLTDPMHISRVDMHDIEGFTSLIDMAAQHNQLAVGLAHGVQPADAEEDDPLADITDEQLREVLDYIEQSDVEVITPSQLIDSV
ncbi:MAG: polysaccharide deacetylase family protein, partial [Halalkalicoccus sp.]|nr:polysaccharide deacetylase family protein [Halalkalicoccus sp.]